MKVYDVFGSRLATELERVSQGSRDVSVSLAESTGYTHAYVLGVIRGTRRPGLAFAVAAAHEMNISLNYLVGLSNVPSPLVKE